MGDAVFVIAGGHGVGGAFTPSLAFPMAMAKPLRSNMATSLRPSPITAISGGTPSNLASSERGPLVSVGVRHIEIVVLRAGHGRACAERIAHLALAAFEERVVIADADDLADGSR